MPSAVARVRMRRSARCATPSGETPLIAALYRGHARGGRNCWRPRQARRSMICSGAALGRARCVERALAADPRSIDARAYDGWTPLHLAAFFGEARRRRASASAGADIQRHLGQQYRQHAAARGRRRRSRRGGAGADRARRRRERASTQEDTRRCTSPRKAGYVPVVEALLARDADPHAVDAEDRTPLSRAAARNHAAIVDLINWRAEEPQVWNRIRTWAGKAQDTA